MILKIEKTCLSKFTGAIDLHFWSGQKHLIKAVLILRGDLVRAVPPGLAVIDVDETVWPRYRVSWITRVPGLLVNARDRDVSEINRDRGTRYDVSTVVAVDVRQVRRTIDEGEPIAIPGPRSLVISMAVEQVDACFHIEADVIALGRPGLELPGGREGHRVHTELACAAGSLNWISSIVSAGASYPGIFSCRSIKTVVPLHVTSL